MSPTFPSERLADPCHHARLIVEQAGHLEAKLEALVAAAERDSRQRRGGYNGDLKINNSLLSVVWRD